MVLSVDRAGILEYWTGPKQDYKFPSKLVSFESKLDTSKNCFSSMNFHFFHFSMHLGLYEFAKSKTIVSGLAFSNDGKKFATLSTDRKVGGGRCFSMATFDLRSFLPIGSSLYIPQRQANPRFRRNTSSILRDAAHESSYSEHGIRSTVLQIIINFSVQSLIFWNRLQNG